MIKNYVDSKMDALQESIIEKIADTGTYLMGVTLDIIAVLIMGCLVYFCYRLMMGDKKQIDYLFFGLMIYTIVKFVTHFV